MPYGREPMGICEKCGTLRPFSEIFCERCGGQVKRLETQLGLPSATFVSETEPSENHQMTSIPETLQRLSPPEGILKNPKGCLRAIQALKAGRAPREGIRFLSVGLDSVIQRLQKSFQRSSQLEPQTFWLVGDYGEGKSHLLRLTTSLAEENGFAWAYVVHDKEQLLGLHKPAWLFRNILWSLQWSYPTLRLSRFEKIMIAPPSYWFDRRMREELPTELIKLLAELRQQGFKGLALCIDEVENFANLTIKQLKIAVQILEHLFQLPNMPILCFLGCTRSILRDDFENAVKIETPPLTKENGDQVTERIYRLHSVAFEWEPTISIQEISEKAWDVAESIRSGRWRAFVQSVVAQLEIAHQKVHPSSISTFKLSPKPKPIQTTLTAKAPTVIQQLKASTLRVGDRVEIVKGPLREWRGTVLNIRDDQVEVALDGPNQCHLWISSDSLKKLR